MYLVEAEAASGARAGQAPAGHSPAIALPTERWQDFPYTQISHHRRPCCDIAREWVIQMDFAQLNGADLVSGPRWLRARYKWGPSQWPLHWCECVRLESIDCGAHSALSREVFEARGLRAFPAQLVQRYSEDATEQWGERWVEGDATLHWLDRNNIYHEVTALLFAPGEVKIWDPSAGGWITPPRFSDSQGYGAVVAIRIFAARSDLGGTVAWGHRQIEPNVWNHLLEI